MRIGKVSSHTLRFCCVFFQLFLRMWPNRFRDEVLQQRTQSRTPDVFPWVFESKYNRNSKWVKHQSQGNNEEKATKRAMERWVPDVFRRHIEGAIIPRYHRICILRGIKRTYSRTCNLHASNFEAARFSRNFFSVACNSSSLRCPANNSASSLLVVVCKDSA